jgi:D-alanyl-D-alanine carboxypeptidase
MSSFWFKRALCALTLTVAMLCIARAPAFADDAGAPANASAARALAQIVAADRAANRVQSVIFGAWKGLYPLLTTAAGESFTGIPATTGMHIRPGIVETEALTTILVQLAQRRPGLLDERLSRWFPALECAEGVTLRMLANQRSGYGDYVTDPSFLERYHADPFQTLSPGQLISIGIKNTGMCRPGSGFRYSHTNAVILGEVLKRITGKSIATLIDERIAQPLHITQTVIPVTSDPSEPAQHTFTRERGPYEDATYWNPSWAINSGTIVSALYDVAVMQRAFGSGALLSKAGFAQYLAPTNAGDPPQSKDFYFAFGVIVGNTWILQHAQVDGSDVVMGYLPSRDLTIVVSTALGVDTVPLDRGYSLQFFDDAARYLAREKPIPAPFLKL